MRIYLTWSQFKVIITNKAKLRFNDRESFYALEYQDELGIFETSVVKDSGADQTDFEANYQSYANKPYTVGAMIQPFADKVLPSGKKLYVRNYGIQQALSVGANTINYACPYPWAKLIGAEIIGCEILDYTDFKVYDDASGTYSGTPNALLNQFGYGVNLPKDYYVRMAPYDADLYYGIVLKLTYNSISAKTVGLNILMNQVV